MVSYRGYNNLGPPVCEPTDVIVGRIRHNVGGAVIESPSRHSGGSMIKRWGDLRANPMVKESRRSTYLSPSPPRSRLLFFSLPADCHGTRGPSTPPSQGHLPHQPWHPLTHWDSFTSGLWSRERRLMSSYPKHKHQSPFELPQATELPVYRSLVCRQRPSTLSKTAQ